MYIPKTQEQITEMGKYIFANRVYTPANVPENVLTLVFMVLIFAHEMFDDMTEDEKKSLIPVGVFEKHATVGRFINGYPMFVECEFWHIDDFVKANEISEKLNSVLNAVDEKDVAVVEAYIVSPND